MSRQRTVRLRATWVESQTNGFGGTSHVVIGGLTPGGKSVRVVVDISPGMLGQLGKAVRVALGHLKDALVAAIHVHGGTGEE